MRELVAAGAICHFVVLGLRDEFSNTDSAALKLLSYFNHEDVEACGSAETAKAVSVNPSLVSDRSLLLSTLIISSTLLLDSSYAPCVAAFFVGWECGLALHSGIRRFY